MSGVSFPLAFLIEMHHAASWKLTTLKYDLPGIDGARTSTKLAKFATIGDL